jgi:hypothetical protein
MGEVILFMIIPVAVHFYVFMIACWKVREHVFNAQFHGLIDHNQTLNAMPRASMLN